LSYPVGLAFDSAGNLYEVDVGLGNTSGKIYEFSTSGAQSLFASGLNNPQGLAFDSAGNLYEADYGSGKVNEFTSGGVESTFASGLSGPTFIAFSGEPLPVPEPSACGLMLIGATLLLVLCRTCLWPNTGANAGWPLQSRIRG
jgi:DNA-binding beta-propeller fold protein YncE